MTGPESLFNAEQQAVLEETSRLVITSGMAPIYFQNLKRTAGRAELLIANYPAISERALSTGQRLIAQTQAATRAELPFGVFLNHNSAAHGLILCKVRLATAEALRGSGVQIGLIHEPSGYSNPENGFTQQQLDIAHRQLEQQRAVGIEIQ